MRAAASLSLVLLGLLASRSPAQAQAFADARASAVDYSRAEFQPGRPCDALAGYKGRDLVELHATAVAADGSVTNVHA